MPTYPENSDQWYEILNRYKDELRSLVIRFNASDLTAWDTAFLHRDLKALARILHITWDKAPDQPFIHVIEGWSQLCDLCTDSYLLIGELI